MNSTWCSRLARSVEDTVDLDLLEETALAIAQATIQNSLDDAGINRSEMARRMGRPRSYITRILQGDHNLTVKTLARALGACGREMNLNATLPVCTWASQDPNDGIAKAVSVAKNEQLAFAA